MARLDHFIWVVHPQNIKRYVAAISELFNAQFDFMDGPSIGPWPAGRGIHAYVAWDAGLEIVAPLHADDPLAARFHKHLTEHGEGPFGIVVAVDDLEVGLARATTLGYPVEQALQASGSDERMERLRSWTVRVTDVREAFVGEFLGLNLLLGQIEYASNSRRPGIPSHSAEGEWSEATEGGPGH